jgi:hypothetical protein
MIAMKFTPSALDTILAGLRLLAIAVEDGSVQPNDRGIGNIMTNDGQHPAATVEDIEYLAETINTCAFATIFERD